MKEILDFFEIYEPVIYFLLSLGGIVYLWRFWEAWEAVRESVYGLERDSAQRRLNHTATTLLLMLIMAVTVFSLVTFVEPIVPGTNLLTAQPVETPSDLDLTATAQSNQGGSAQSFAITTPLPTIDVNTDGCLDGKIEISFPTA
ncbi:MAG: hypothetical protein OEZ02_11140, partial [Anaerolineae bacterium]|nr:hypothetical protein [Anaerolineae bacterium]